MSLWQMHCAIAGFIKAHTVEEKIKPPTPEQFYERMRMLETVH